MSDRIRIVEGDITALKVDAIVNAANNDLILGAGVAGAIARRGGPSIQTECDKIGAIKIGEAALTGGGNLPAKWVIHAAAMGLGRPATAEGIKNSTNASLALARDKRMSAVAFPALGTGIAGFPLEECAKIMIKETVDFFVVNDYPETVIFCLWGGEAYRTFLKQLIKGV